MSQTKVCEQNARGLGVLAWCPMKTTASSGPPWAFVSEGSASTVEGMRSRSMLVPTMCQSPTEMRSAPAPRSASIATSTSSVIRVRPRA